MSKKVSIIDYQMGNLFSVRQACLQAGLNPIITSDPNEIMNSDGVILPGVGAFGDAMQQLKSLNLIDSIKNFIETRKPFFGICLGLQLLLSKSEEFGQYEGLNIIRGEVLKLRITSDEANVIKIPEVGWNQIEGNEEKWNSSPLSEINQGEFMYFVHSFYVQPEKNNIILSETNYEGFRFCSSIKNENIFAVQFHPEKSALNGISIYKQWAASIN